MTSDRGACFVQQSQSRGNLDLILCSTWLLRWHEPKVCNLHVLWNASWRSYECVTTIPWRPRTRLEIPRHCYFARKVFVKEALGENGMLLRFISATHSLRNALMRSSPRTPWRRFLVQNTAGSFKISRLSCLGQRMLYDGAGNGSVNKLLRALEI